MNKKTPPGLIPMHAGHSETAATRPEWPGVRVWQRLAIGLVAGVFWAASAPSSAQTVDSIERGRAVYKEHCAGCHSVDAHREGPAHRGVVGRRAGALKDYDYSPALRDSKLLWTRETLKAWLTDPEALIPGQAMDYSLDDAREREDVVAYLATLKRALQPPAAAAAR